MPSSSRTLLLLLVLFLLGILNARADPVCPATTLSASVNRHIANPKGVIRCTINVATATLRPGVQLTLTLPVGVDYVKSTAVPAQPRPTLTGREGMWMNEWAGGWMNE